MILVLGTPKMGRLTFGNPHMRLDIQNLQELATLASVFCSYEGLNFDFLVVAELRWGSKYWNQRVIQWLRDDWKVSEFLKTRVPA